MMRLFRLAKIWDGYSDLSLMGIKEISSHTMLVWQRVTAGSPEPHKLRRLGCRLFGHLTFSRLIIVELAHAYFINVLRNYYPYVSY